MSPMGLSVRLGDHLPTLRLRRCVRPQARSGLNFGTNRLQLLMASSFVHGPFVRGGAMETASSFCTGLGTTEWE